MSIADRLEDAEYLWQGGRREGALLSVLIAFAATARRVSPDSRDRQAFETLFESSTSITTEVALRDKPMRIGHLFYKWLRCELVHEGGLPVDIEFCDDGPDPLPMIRESGPGQPLLLGNGWFDLLMYVVESHPINRDLFPWREEWLREARTQRAMRLLGRAELSPDAPSREPQSRMELALE